MALVRVVFTEPQRFGTVTVGEMTVDADRLVLMNGNDVPLDVPAEVVRVVDQGATARTDRLRSAHRNHGRPWSEHEESELRRLWAEGAGMPALVEHFGRSRNAVSSAVRRLRLPERGGKRRTGGPSGDALA